MDPLEIGICPLFFLNICFPLSFFSRDVYFSSWGIVISIFPLQQRVNKNFEAASFFLFCFPFCFRRLSLSRGLWRKDLLNPFSKPNFSRAYLFLGFFKILGFIYPFFTISDSPILEVPVVFCLNLKVCFFQRTLLRLKKSYSSKRERFQLPCQFLYGPTSNPTVHSI